jgi:hypothetical protein
MFHLDGEYFSPLTYSELQKCCPSIKNFSFQIFFKKIGSFQKKNKKLQFSKNFFKKLLTPFQKLKTLIF